MKFCKRLEIVVEQTLGARVEDLLKSLNVDGYTSIPEAGGLGERGYRRADEITGTSGNSIYILAIEDEALMNEVIESVRPILKISGGICLVSDAYFVIH